MTAGKKYRPIIGNDPYVTQLAKQATQLHKLMPMRPATRGDEGLRQR